MADQLTDNDTAAVAKLILLGIAQQDLPRYTQQLNKALDPAATMQELETNNVPILSHPTGLTTDGDEDEVQPSLSQQEALKNAEAAGNTVLGYFKVKKVLD